DLRRHGAAQAAERSRRPGDGHALRRSRRRLRRRPALRPADLRPAPQRRLALAVDRWFDGVWLLGQYTSLNTGCWLLAHGRDAAVVLRVSAFAGDWGREPLRWVHEHAVPRPVRLASIVRLLLFVRDADYWILRTWSVHANDRREGVDFVALMATTREDCKLW